MAAVIVRVLIALITALTICSVLTLAFALDLINNTLSH